MANYMIHTVPERMWYVQKYLIPSMLAQGIDREHIAVYEDSIRLGNLMAFLDSIEAYCTTTGGTWHLQDDIIISSDFKKVTEENDRGIVAGFSSNFDKSLTYWYSFQCMRIPNVLAIDFVRWIDTVAPQIPEYKAWIETNKCDDSLFQAYCRQKHFPMTLLDPNIVNHVDYLIGGSIINIGREVIVSNRWREPELIDKLREELKNG